MRFACLGSGSKGNAWLVESGTTRLMIDCGFGLRVLVSRLARLGLEPGAISAVVLTHEHSDHVGGVACCAAKYGFRVLATHGTALAADLLAQVEIIDSHSAFAIGDLHVQPFPVPHDAREPVQFVVSDGASRLGLLTDCGHITVHLRTLLDGCDGLVLECNHDLDLLANGPYPGWLKDRVAGRYGHLSNDQAAQLLASLDCARLRHVVAAHLSEKNNRPELVVGALAAVLGYRKEWISIADQVRGLDWRDL